jgi:hypothetical protein
MWNHNLMEGEGTMTYRNGDVYAGQWMAGKQFGEGVMNFKGSELVTGTWSGSAESDSSVARSVFTIL